MLNGSTPDQTSSDKLQILNQYKLLDLAMFMRKSEMDLGGGQKNSIEALVNCVQSVHQLVVDATVDEYQLESRALHA